MPKLSKVKPTIVKLNMLKLFIIVKLLMTKIAIMKLNMAKKMME
jgi:hypothetical protein